MLLQVETTCGHSDDLLHGAELRNLSQADRNLATALVMGVLRWQIALDAELKARLAGFRSDGKNPVKVDANIRIAQGGSVTAAGGIRNLVAELTSDTTNSGGLSDLGSDLSISRICA